MNSFDTFVYYFGLISLLNILVIIVIRICLFLWRCCAKKGVIWCGGPNTWAVITGATDGIGLEYARQLAAKGYNLLLLSRSLEKLNRVRDEIRDEHKNCDIRVLAVDFTSTDIYDRIEEELKKLHEIHVLINNVGIHYSGGVPEYFTRLPNLNKLIMDMINGNTIACTRLIALVLPKMEERGRGIIVNISSMGALTPWPMYTIYNATKAYTDFLSRALNEEYKSKGIVIQSLLPGGVKTKMSKLMEGDRNDFISTEQYVRSALKTVGKNDTCCGHPFHEFQASIFKTLDHISNIYGFDFITKIIHYGMYREMIKITKRQND